MGELIVTFGEDGKAHMYDSDFDVTIHCEDEQRKPDALAQDVREPTDGKGCRIRESDCCLYGR